MDEDIVEYTIETFVKIYLLFAPSDAAVDACVNKLLISDDIPMTIP